jgi:hypothetical protein
VDLERLAVQEKPPARRMRSSRGRGKAPQRVKLLVVVRVQCLVDRRRGVQERQMCLLDLAGAALRRTRGLW